jgi:diguanylate cyclase (GGDEF)-like protein
MGRSWRHLLVVSLVALCLATPGATAQRSGDRAALERRLPSAGGLERARILAELVDRTRGDDPEAALHYGHEALALLDRDPEPATRVRVLAEMAWAAMVQGDREEAEDLARRARDVARRVGFPEGEARAINNLGVVARRWGEPLGAIDLFTQALEVYRRIGAGAEVAMSLNNLGVVYAFDLADYEQALEHQLDALEIRRSLGDPEDLALSYNNLGVIYQRLGRFPEAREHFEEALAIRRDLGIKHRVAGTLNNLGDLAVEMGDHEGAVAYHQEALEIRRDIGDASALPMALRSLAAAFARLGRLPAAETLAVDSVAAADAMQAPREKATSLLILADVRRRQGRLDEASQLARQALALAEQVSAADLVRRSARDLAEIEETRGDYPQALAAYRRFKEVGDEIFDEERTRRVEMLEARYQAERREREIERLESERALQALELQRQRWLRNGVAAGAAVLGVVGLVLIHRHRALARLHWELERVNRRLEEMSLTDPLTGLRNRRFVLQSLEADVATSLRSYRRTAAEGERSRLDLVFLLLDLDHFKSVNDTHGHEAGDAVLRQLADLLRAQCREADTVARWGGEEFLIVSRSTRREEAGIFAERLRSAVAEHPFVLPDGDVIHRTTSIGVAVLPFLTDHPDALGWEQVVDLADRALYAAKSSGRDAWVIVEARTGELAEAAAEPDVDLDRWHAAGVLSFASSRPLGSAPGPQA